ncbi:MAG: enoyl-CoA hydratase/isomerase family protein [Acidimicrobiales bacterium]
MIGLAGDWTTLEVGARARSDGSCSTGPSRAMPSARGCSRSSKWRGGDGRRPRGARRRQHGQRPAFQTGLDVVQLARDKAALRASSRQTRDFALRMTAWHCGVTKPVIAAVNGTCAGGGLHFVADADIVIAVPGATFLDPHVSVGQVSAFESIGLIRKGGFAAAARMALLGSHERLSAARALQLGMVSELVPPDELRGRAQALGETLAAQDPARLAALKTALWSTLEHP